MLDLNSELKIILIVSSIILFIPAYAEEPTPIIIEGEYIVTYKDAFRVGELLYTFESDIQSLQPFTHENNVFLIKTDYSNYRTMKDDTRILSIEPNMLLQTTGYSNGMPFGVDRIEGDQRAGMADGVDDALDVDIAVFDTGINQNNPDMRIVNCVSFVGGSCTDTNGHGSHTAGTIAAKDNTEDNIIGVAEGARIHALKVCDNGCTLSNLIRAADWVTARANEIEVVSMSLGGYGAGADKSCTNTATHANAFQAAVCKMYEAGIIVVVSAGNDNLFTSSFFPCVWDATICVSAITDTDGKPGGLGDREPCRSSASPEFDDERASFSNYGNAIDITAPGVCIKSYDANGNEYTLSGTSMSAPHVAGAAALATLNFLNPTNAAEVDQVKQFLLDEGYPRDSPNGWARDLDDFAEPLVKINFGEATPPGEPTTPVLESAILFDMSDILEWSQPDTSLGSPDGGYDILIDGIDTNETWRTTNLKQTITGLDTSVKHCFSIQARWTQVVNLEVFIISNELCVDPFVTPPPCDTECMLEKKIVELEQIINNQQATISNQEQKISELEAKVKDLENKECKKKDKKEKIKKDKNADKIDKKKKD